MKMNSPKIELLKAGFDDLQTIWKMQAEAFSELYAKYHDTENQPGNGEDRQDHSALQSAGNDLLFYYGGWRKGRCNPRD